MSFSSLTFTWSTVLCLFWIPKITFSPRLLCCSFCAICGGHEDDDRQQQQRRRRRRRWSDMIKEPSPPLQDEEKEGEGGRQERTSHLPSKDFLPRWKLDIQGTEDIGYDTVMSQMRPYGLNFDSNCPLSLCLYFFDDYNRQGTIPYLPQTNLNSVLTSNIHGIRSMIRWWNMIGSFSCWKREMWTSLALRKTNSQSTPTTMVNNGRWWEERSQRDEENCWGCGKWFHV